MRDIFEKGRDALRRGLRARASGEVSVALEAYREAIARFEESAQWSAYVIALNNSAALLQTKGAKLGAKELVRLRGAM